MALLQIRMPSGERVAVVWPAGQDAFAIGRARDNDLVVGDDRVSRYHARLERAGAGVVLRDLGSNAGTTLDGAPIAGPVALARGAVFVIAGMELALVDVAAEAWDPPVAVGTRWGTSGRAAVDWASLVERVGAAARDRQEFLSRAEERVLKEQAGDDYRAGDQMVEAMERFARMGRDRALARLQTWSPPPGRRDAASTALLAVRELEQVAEPKDYYGRLGVAYVILTLERELGIAGGR